MPNKKASKTGRFVEGALIGAALGVAAGVFANSKTGKKFSKVVGKDVKKESVEFYKYVAPKIKKAQKMSESQYRAFVKESIKAYGRGKKLSVKDTAALVKEAHSMWTKFNKEVKSSKTVKRAVKPVKRAKKGKK